MGCLSTLLGLPKAIPWPEYQLVGSRALPTTVSLIPPPNLLPRPSVFHHQWETLDCAVSAHGIPIILLPACLQGGTLSSLASYRVVVCPSTLASSLQLSPSAEQVDFCTSRTRTHTPSPSTSQLVAHDWSPSTVNFEAIRLPVCRVPPSPVDRIDRLQTPAPSSSEIRITALLEQQGHTRGCSVVAATPKGHPRSLADPHPKRIVGLVNI